MTLMWETTFYAPFHTSKDMKKGMKVSDLNVAGTVLSRCSFALVQVSEVAVTFT